MCASDELRHHFCELDSICVVYGGSKGGSMGLVEPPFLPQVHPESPGNGVSDVPDFKHDVTHH